MSHRDLPGHARPALRGAGAVVALACALLAPACIFDARRYPGPVEAEVLPLPPGAEPLMQRGPEEVLVMRHSDPVQVRPAGSAGAYPLTFYSKRVRINAGSAVFVAPGGRAEILWPNGTSLVLSDESVGLIGSPSRGQPIFLLASTDHATLQLVPGDEVMLQGGAILTGESGPYVLDRLYADILRVHNQSKGTLEIAYRDAIFELGPGHAVDLPLLEAGSVPLDPVGFRRIPATGFEVGVRGDARSEVQGTALLLSAGEPAEVDALGLRLRLAAGEEVLLDGLAPQGAPNLIPE